MWKWVIPDNIWDNFKLDTLVYIQAIIYRRFDKVYTIYPTVSREWYDKYNDLYQYPNVVDRTR